MAWYESNALAALIGAAVSGALTIGLRWADLPRPRWVLDGSGGGADAQGNWSGTVDLLNAGGGAALGVAVRGINCSANASDKNLTRQGQDLTFIETGARLRVLAKWGSSEQGHAAVEVSWLETTLWRRTRRRTLWVMVGPHRGVHQLPASMTVREFRSASRRVDVLLGRPRPWGRRLRHILPKRRA